MMIRNFLIMMACFFNISSLVAKDESEDAQFANWRRSQLTVKNETHQNEDGDSRSLYLIWAGDIEHPPQYTGVLNPGQKDTKDSTLTDLSWGIRNFTVSVYRIKDNQLKHVGSFTHGILSSFGRGHEETVTIFKNYTANRVELWGETYKSDGGDGVQRVTFPIGSLPREEW